MVCEEGATSDGGEALSDGAADLVSEAGVAVEDGAVDGDGEAGRMGDVEGDAADDGGEGDGWREREGEREYLRERVCVCVWVMTGR